MFLSSCYRDLRVPTEFQQGNEASSRLKAWNSAFLSSCKRDVRPPVESRQRNWAFPRGVTRESDLPSFCEGTLGVTCKSVKGNQA